jgi:hypothetical protein
MDVIHRVEIKDYLDEIVISKARRTLYKEDKDGNKVVSNPRTAGKPRTRKISGQVLWVGMNHHLRSKIARELKKYFYEFYRDVKIEFEYPIGIAIDFYGKEGEFDLDNLCILYRKCLHDALAGHVDFIADRSNESKTTYKPDYEKYPPIIKDDSVLYITENLSRFINSEDKKMIITLYKPNGRD